MAAEASDAGIGDPYWYEWTVGLRQVVRLLDPDSLAVGVTFQATVTKGVDDVVVRFRDGHREWIQVKHTRDEATLTFGDLVRRDPQTGTSLLRSLAGGWSVECAKHDGRGRVVLFTNREFGTRHAPGGVRSDSAGLRHTRPPLAKFWPWTQETVRSVTRLSEIRVPDDWADAWTEWLAELELLENDDARLEFLRSLDLVYTEAGLEELEGALTEDLARIFGVTGAQTRPLLQALHSALSRWATSRRGSDEEVTGETVCRELCGDHDSREFDHMLPPPEPLLPSRAEFLEDLATAVRTRKAPIVFLSGPPAIGKTSLISALASRTDAISARYHAFRPITPDQPILLADAGELTKPRVLWSALLTQLRGQLQRVGRLLASGVALRNEFLSIDALRSEALRVASMMAVETGKTFVLAIDGLDHAARAGVDTGTFLATLPAPDSIPKGVCLLLAGQPATDYPSYPSWLRSPRDDVHDMRVPGTTQNDVFCLLVAAIDRDAQLLAIQAGIIHQVTNGNTLAVVFAIAEAKEISDPEELDRRLREQRLHDGIDAYLDLIWKAAVSRLPAAMTLGQYLLAGALSLAQERVTGTMMAGIAKDWGVPAALWTECLHLLRPLIVEDQGGFRAALNAVRVHLTSVLRSDPTRFTETAARLADFYLAQPLPSLAKHRALFALLRLAGRSQALAELFGPGFVLEARVVGRTLAEVRADALVALTEAAILRDWSLLHNVACGIRTIQQVEGAVLWSNDAPAASEPAGIVPTVVASECWYPSKLRISLDVLAKVLHDAKRLLELAETDRATTLVTRWFVVGDPDKLLATLPHEEVFDPAPAGAIEQLTTRATLVLRGWGELSARLRLRARLPDRAANRSSACPAFWGGFVHATTGLQRIRIFKRGPLFVSDLEAAVEASADANNWAEVAVGLRRLTRSRAACGLPFLAKAAIWSLLLGDGELSAAWTEPMGTLEPARFRAAAERGDQLAPEGHAWAAFLFGRLRPSESPQFIAQELLRSYDRRGSERVSNSLLLRACAWAGRWWGAVVVRGSTGGQNMVPVAEVTARLTDLLECSAGKKGSKSSEFDLLAAKLIEVVVYLAGQTGIEWTVAVRTVFEAYLATLPIEAPAVPVLWDLADRDPDRVRAWARAVFDPGGVAEELELASREDVLTRFRPILNRTMPEGWIAASTARFRWGGAAYAGRKEYSLARPLAWFEDLSRLHPAAWSTSGLRLQTISSEASRVGGNREAFYIEAAIAKAACVEGPAAALRLTRLRRSADSRPAVHPGSIVDGLVGMLEDVSPGESELLAVWTFIVGSESWEDRGGRQSLADGRDALLSAGRRSNLDLFDRLHALAPSEAGLEADDTTTYKRPYTWFQLPSDPENDGLPVELAGALKVVEAQLAEGSAEASRCLHLLGARLARTTGSDVSPLVPHLFRVAQACPSRFDWVSDGVLSFYEELIPRLGATQRWEVVDKVLREIDLEDWRALPLESASETLDMLCQLNARARGRAELDVGLERLLSMHETWITGNGKLRTMPGGSNSGAEALSASVDWASFAAQVLLDRVDSPIARRKEAALRGLYSLFEVTLDARHWAAAWQHADTQKRLWLCLLAERAGAEHPEKLTSLIPLLQEALAEEVDLELRLEAWIALSAVQRLSGSAPPSWPTPARVSTRVNVAPPAFAVAGPTRGSAANPAGFAVDAIRSLEVVAGARLPDAIRNEILAGPSETEDQAVDMTMDEIDGEVVMRPRSSWRRHLMTVLGAGLSEDPIRELAPHSLAQVLVCGDEPFVFLRSPTPTKVPSAWPHDETADELFASRGLKAALSACTHDGLATDETVLGARIVTYSARQTFKLVVDRVWRQRLGEVGPAPRRYSVGGRGFSMFNPDRYEPPTSSESLRLTLDAGGVSSFHHSGIWCFPARLWGERLGWIPVPSNPLAWRDSTGRIVARFERLRGPPRDIHLEPYYRQPMLFRWVSPRSVIEAIQESLGQQLQFVEDLVTQRFNGDE